jgi:hypothetical protein
MSKANFVIIGLLATIALILVAMLALMLVDQRSRSDLAQRTDIAGAFSTQTGVAGKEQTEGAATYSAHAYETSMANGTAFNLTQTVVTTNEWATRAAGWTQTFTILDGTATALSGKSNNSRK